MKKKLGIILIIAFLILITFSGIVILYYIKISREISKEIRSGIVRTAMASESPVYYDDRLDIIGVFFDKSHQTYSTFEKLPKDFINALIAAEDKNFFKHFGFDIPAIIRASIANLKAGRITQGGSTITQQTAKNLFNRQKRSYAAKFKELVQAMGLEREYSKKEILELYVNQFHVSGTGKGIAFAAQYFFSKAPEDLDLVEASFIAGSIKGPSRYNPFTKKTEREKILAVQSAKERKDYVLSRMYALGFITDEQYKQAVTEDIPFKKGQVTYGMNVILDIIRRQLQSEYFRKILSEQGIDNIATSGIKIYSSINREIQEGAIKSLRKHLPILETRLSGYKKDSLNKFYLDLEQNGLKDMDSDLPDICEITGVDQDENGLNLTVNVEGNQGLISFDNGIRQLCEAWVASKYGAWAKFEKKYIKGFVDSFKPGDLAAVQQGKGESGPLYLTRIPSLQGGILVLEKGMVKAMVGGYLNYFLNRAVDSRRQLGSIFKPIVYSAALQLKWNNLDPLPNIFDVFSYCGKGYDPKPDHDPVANRVSMVWAGAKSENLASVWLLYHITDHLNQSEFGQLVRLVGLDRGTEESYEDYKMRIRDKNGIVINDDILKSVSFDESLKEIVPDLIFSSREEVLDDLNRLQFRIEDKARGHGKERDWDTYSMNFERIQELNLEMKRKLEMFRMAKENSRLKDMEDGVVRGFYLSPGEAAALRLEYFPQGETSDVHTIGEPVTFQWFMNNLNLIDTNHIWIEGVFPSTVIDMIQSGMDNYYVKLKKLPSYDPEILFKVRDFRVLVGLLYVTQLAREMGISEKLDPVLSFPLGSNAISLAEAATVYQTIMTGKVYSDTDEISRGSVRIIKKILDRDGAIIWEAEQKSEKVLSDRVYMIVRDILKQVIENGTGKSAREKIIVKADINNVVMDIPIPVFGKTGTSNDYTNSSFVGFIPKPGEIGGDDPEYEGYSIACYVGYDDNQPMKGEKITIYGSSGALPIWIDTANTIVNSKGFLSNLQMADLIFDSSPDSSIGKTGLEYIMISPIDGLLVPEDQTGSKNEISVLSDIGKEGNTIVLRKKFEPFNKLLKENNSGVSN